MNKSDLTLNFSAAEMNGVVDDVQEFFKAERGSEYSADMIRTGIHKILSSKLELLAEDLREMFTSPQNEETHELAKMLARSAPENTHVTSEVTEPVAESVFNGERKFSAAKLGAMMEYLLSKGRYVYKTNLNKLLFYSDMTAFYLNGQGISGSVYLNRPFGPVADPAAEILDDLIDAGKVKIADGTKHFVADPTRSDVLDDKEIEVLDWVLKTYGEMGAREISDLSHTERAYKDTRPNEPIAYAYAKFFKTLPIKSSFGN